MIPFQIGVEIEDAYLQFLISQFPVIIPMIYGRVDDKVYLHGHLSTGLLKALSEDDVKACVAVTLVQGLSH
jgi:uncharacterized protein